MPPVSDLGGRVLERLRALAGPGPLRCVVAWSGGLDSTVLLHILAQAARVPGAAIHVRAVHVNHGLQPAAPRFAAFCRRTARAMRVPLMVRTLELRVPRGESVEEMARLARYQALARVLRPGELLLSAQHADDQAESLLLALLRGAGPAGLAAMPEATRFAEGRLLRPLLAFERAALRAYAGQHALAWVDDPTNEDPRFDRNYLRLAVLPVLRARWPALARTLGRSARHCAAATAVLEAAARRDLERALDGPDLAVPVLRRFSAARRAAVLRAWLALHGRRALEERHVAQVEGLIAARADAHPELRLPGLAIRRVAGRLELAAELAGRTPIC